MDIIREKIAQARRVVASSDLDAWLIFVRETSENADPVLSFFHRGALTWQSAILFFKSGATAVVLGNFDADPLIAGGLWDEVVPYVQGIREPLAATLQKHLPDGGWIGVNFSRSDVKADGLSHGMYLLLAEYLQGTRFELVSAGEVCQAVRSRKTESEIARMKGAISETDLIFAQVPEWCRTAPTEADLYRRIQEWIDERGFGYSWDRAGDPIVNSGPDSMVGHGIPSDKITVSAGHILHIDLGIVCHGYSSDIQRCWYVPERGEIRAPADVLKAFMAVVDAITMAADALRPGVQGWEVDKVARDHIVQCGYPEYLHALGHQVGRVAHDGGSILGPRWERYGDTPCTPVEANQVYTLELGVTVPGRGSVSLEEMVVVRESAVEWLTQRQLEMPLL